MHERRRCGSFAAARASGSIQRVADAPRTPAAARRWKSRRETRGDFDMMRSFQQLPIEREFRTIKQDPENVRQGGGRITASTAAVDIGLQTFHFIGSRHAAQRGEIE